MNAAIPRERFSDLQELQHTKIRDFLAISAQYFDLYDIKWQDTPEQTSWERDEIRVPSKVCEGARQAFLARSTGA